MNLPYMARKAAIISEEPKNSEPIALPVDKPIIFAGVKFGQPISNSLKVLGILEPSPIQKAAIVPLTTGLSCILHVSLFFISVFIRPYSNS
jgi:hypothetical protein